MKNIIAYEEESFGDKVFESLITFFVFTFSGDFAKFPAKLKEIWGWN